MKKLIVTILLISTFTCGCTNSHNNEETFSQEEIQQTNQGVSEEINEKSSLNNEEPTSESKTQENETEKLHPIDKAERDCIAKDYSNAGMNECGYKAMDSWFKEIDKYLGLLKTVTSEEDYTKILKAQEDWKKYQESEFVSISLIRNKQGTIYQTIAIGQYVHIIKQRAFDLKSLYEYLIE